MVVELQFHPLSRTTELLSLGILFKKMSDLTEQPALIRVVEMETIEAHTGTQGCVCQQCEDKAKQKRKEGAADRRLVDLDEFDRAERAKWPERFETWKPMTEPPDINLKRLIMHDEKEIEKLFEDQNLHFTERCLRYATRDVMLEQEVLGQYERWIKAMIQDSEMTGDRAREAFFEDISKVVKEHQTELSDEREVHVAASNERLRQTVAQTLCIPAEKTEWSEEHLRRFSNYDAYVPGWGDPKDEYELLLVAQELEIPINIGDWLPEHFRTFSQCERFVIGWGYSGHERERQRVALELGVPAFQKEWRAEDWQRLSEYGKDVVGWEDPSQEARRQRVAQELGIHANFRAWAADDKQKYIDYSKSKSTSEAQVAVPGWPTPWWREDPMWREIKGRSAIKADQSSENRVIAERMNNKTVIDDRQSSSAVETEPVQRSSHQPKTLNPFTNLEPTTTSDTKPSTFIASAPALVSNIQRYGISPYQALTLLVVALVLYELTRENLSR